MIVHHYVVSSHITNYLIQAMELDPQHFCVKSTLDGGYENVMIINPRQIFVSTSKTKGTSSIWWVPRILLSRLVRKPS